MSQHAMPFNAVGFMQAVIASGMNMNWLPDWEIGATKNGPGEMETRNIIDSVVFQILNRIYKRLGVTPPNWQLLAVKELSETAVNPNHVFSDDFQNQMDVLKIVYLMAEAAHNGFPEGDVKDVAFNGLEGLLGKLKQENEKQEFNPFGDNELPPDFDANLN